MKRTLNSELPFATAFNYEGHVMHHVRGEVNDLPSVTVPDMAMSLEEIVARFASGRDVPVNQNLMFTGDALLPDVRKMDLVEYHEAVEAQKQKIHDLNVQLRQRRQAALDSKKDEGKDKDVKDVPRETPEPDK